MEEIKYKMKTIVLICLLSFLGHFACGQDNNIRSDSAETVNSDSTLVSGYYLVVDRSAIYRKLEKTGEIFYLFKTPVLTVQNISSMDISGKEIEMYVGPARPDGHNPMLYSLYFKFDSEGKCAWANAIVDDTIPYRRIAFVLNDNIIQVQKFDIKTEKCIQSSSWDTKEDLVEIKKIIEDEKRK